MIEGFLIDYHQILLILAFFLLIITILMIFSIHTKHSMIGALILIGLNLNVCWICLMGSFSINVYGFTTSGTVVNNPIADIQFLFALFLAMWLANVALAFYTPLEYFNIVKKEKMQDKFRDQRTQLPYSDAGPSHNISPKIKRL